MPRQRQYLCPMSSWAFGVDLALFIKTERRAAGQTMSIFLNFVRIFGLPILTIFQATDDPININPVTHPWFPSEPQAETANSRSNSAVNWAICRSVCPPFQPNSRAIASATIAAQFNASLPATV